MIKIRWRCRGFDFLFFNTINTNHHPSSIRLLLYVHSLALVPFSHKSTHFPQMAILMQQITNLLLTLNGLWAQMIFLNDMLHQLVSSWGWCVLEAKINSEQTNMSTAWNGCMTECILCYNACSFCFDFALGLVLHFYFAIHQHAIRVLGMREKYETNVIYADYPPFFDRHHCTLFRQLHQIVLAPVLVSIDGITWLVMRSFRQFLTKPVLNRHSHGPMDGLNDDEIARAPLLLPILENLTLTRNCLL